MFANKSDKKGKDTKDKTETAEALYTENSDEEECLLGIEVSAGDNIANNTNTVRWDLAASTDLAVGMESSMAICHEESARGRSVVHTKSTMGRGDMESAEGMLNEMYAKGSRVTRNNTEGCSFSVYKGDHYLQMESANVENRVNMELETSMGICMIKSAREWSLPWGPLTLCLPRRILLRFRVESTMVMPGVAMPL